MIRGPCGLDGVLLELDSSGCEDGESILTGNLLGVGATREVCLSGDEGTGCVLGVGLG